MGWKRYFRRTVWDAERASEIDQYIAMEMADNIERGMTPEQARGAAQRKFGNATHVREEIYRMNSLNLFENFRRDVAYGLRNLRRSPGFTAVAVVSLALGIGANTAIFSLVNTLMLRSLPVRNPQHLVQLAVAAAETAGVPSTALSFPLFQDMRDRAGVFAGVFGYGGAQPRPILLDGQPETAVIERVGGLFFETLGIQPILGRAFTSEQDPNADRLAVISYAYWQRRFGGDSAVLGTSVRVNNRVFSIAGIGPPRFSGIAVDTATDLWLPIAGLMAARPWLEGPEARNGAWLQILGRLKPGVTADSARPSLQVLFTGSYPQSGARQLVLLPASRGVSNLRRVYTEPLLVLLTVVGLVLLIACANIANLLLARATTRRREIAVRLAIGAARSRLVLQLLAESLLLAVCGGFAGLLVASWAGRALVRMVIDPAVSSVQFHMDAQVLAFTAAITIATGLLFGIGPALRATRVDLTPALKNEAGSLRSRFRLPVAKTLVVAQVALSLMLVLSAVLFVSTFERLVAQDLGFRPESLLVTRFDADARGVLPVYRQLMDRVQALPGVLAVTVSDMPIFGASTWSNPFIPENASDSSGSTNIQRVAPNFFETMQIPVISGRAFTSRDDGSAPKVAIVNEALARRFFPNGQAIGRRFGWSKKAPADTEIVGVVKDVKWRSLREASPAFVYLPMLQPQTAPSYEGTQRDGSLAIRIRGDAAGLFEPVRREIRAINAETGGIRTQASLIEQTLKQERLLAQLSGLFGAIGLLLAAVGLYGTMAYTVSRRTSEMGIRMALGAPSGSLVRMVLRESTVLVLAGVAAGSAAAYGVTGLIEKLLFGVTRTDPAMIAMSAAMLLSVGLLAAWLPALRASRVSPMTALRHE